MDNNNKNIEINPKYFDIFEGINEDYNKKAREELRGKSTKKDKEEEIEL